MPEFPPVPLTLEGASVLHQFFRFDWKSWRASKPEERERVAAQAVAALGALERDPRNRYASAREFAVDLRNPEQVGVADRAELHEWKKRKSHWPKRILNYALLALIPVVIFSLLLWVARRA